MLHLSLLLRQLLIRNYQNFDNYPRKYNDDQMSSETQTSTASGPFDQESTNRTLAIDVEGRRFWVSRELLTMYSPVFEAMLYGEFLEGKKNVIPLPDKKAADFEEFLLCLMPTPEVKKIDHSNAELMLKYADEYQIADLRRRSTDVLIVLEKQWTGSNGRLLEILRIATEYRLKELLPTIIKKCAIEFEMGKLQPMFSKLPVEVVAGLLRYKSEMPSSKKCECKTFSGRFNCCSRVYYSNDKCECRQKACSKCLDEKITAVCSTIMEIADRDVLAFLDRMYTA